jgi:hypothetical protein
LFTDEPITPTRVETLLGLLRGSRREFDRPTLLRVLQPEGLPGVKAGSARLQAVQTLRAAIELGLVKEDEEHGILRLLFERDDPRSTRRILLDALDRRVLDTDEVEPYFAPFYAYLLGLDHEGVAERSHDDWAIRFEKHVYGGRADSNPFNKDKLTGLHRWFSYAGVGWYDSAGTFQPNPCERIGRRLPALFAGERRLAGDEFVARLGECCPELDGGTLFARVHPERGDTARTLTLGVSHALFDLHDDGRLRLHCAHDSRGWSIGPADPSPDGKTVFSDRIDSVEILA